MEFSSRCVYYNASQLLFYSTPTPLSSQSLPIPSHNHLVPAHGACLVTHSSEGRLSEIPGRKMSNQYLVRSHNDGNKLFIKTFHGRPSSKHSRDAFLGTWWRWLPALGFTSNEPQKSSVVLDMNYSRAPIFGAINGNSIILLKVHHRFNLNGPGGE